MSNNNAIATYESVLDTVIDLLSENQKVTVDSVRECLGGGSDSTISPILKKIRKAGTSLHHSETWEEVTKLIESVDKIFPGLFKFFLQYITDSIHATDKNASVNEYSRQQTNTDACLDGVLLSNLHLKLDQKEAECQCLSEKLLTVENALQLEIENKEKNRVSEQLLLEKVNEMLFLSKDILQNFDQSETDKGDDD